jgi:UDP-N-acetylmuramate dehydrogenase
MHSIKQNHPLDKLNTLRLTSQTKYYIALTDIKELPQIVDYAVDIPIFILGGGSNIILPEMYNGLIIHNQLRGIELIETREDYVLVKVMAGEVWDNFVAYTIEHNWFGLENLSLIPGTVGASPIQNIGAYGVEAKDFIHSVEVYDIYKKQFFQLNNAECQFKYRDSYLKHNPHLIVTTVIFRLRCRQELNTSYVDVARAMIELNNPTALDLRNCVIKIRQQKLPDPAVIGNVGSFFHNPILDMAKVKQLQAKYPNIPVYPVNSQMAKVSAGWLIDNLGLKGYRLGNVGIYPKQALVLINHGGAHATEILNLAHYIQNEVWKNYTISLDIEPLIIMANNES